MKKTFEIQLQSSKKMVIKQVDRGSFMDLINSVKNVFEDNNEISKKLITIIPNVEVIRINEVRNSQVDVPFISYVMNGNEEVLRIPRNHRIIWGILFECCK